MNAVIHIEIPFNDGSVIVSGHQSNQNNSHWIFTTIQTPFIIVTPGADGPHPISRHRKFGLKKNPNGSYTFCTRGVDRVQDKLDIISLGGNDNAIKKADPLWESFQEGLRSYIQNNSYGNTITINTPAKWRPKWQEAKNVLINNLPPSTLDECN